MSFYRVVHFGRGSYGCYDAKQAIKALFELFHLVFTWHGGDKAQKRGPLGLQESIMEALDPFGFSDTLVDKLLRPQLEAALRHTLCRAA